MNTLLHRLVALFILLCFGNLHAQEFISMSSAQDVYDRYPARMDTLFRVLDLERPGLEKVKAAFDKGNAVAAAEALLGYYRQATTASTFRKEQPRRGDERDAEADSIVNDIFTFYDLPDHVPRLPDGRLDWTHQGPDGDIEWAWGLNRHGYLLTLMEAWFKTGNPLYARTIDNHLQDWVVGSLPYPGVKSSTAQWRGLEVALRAKVWVRLFFGLVNSQHLTPATKLLMLSSLPEHLHYMRNFHAPAGNWLTMEMSGLAMVATSWPEFKGSSEWVAYAKEQMLAGLKDQVYPDGVQKELTSHYHYVALVNFDQFREICERAGEPLPAEYRSELEKMYQYMAYTVRPSGHGILNNDSDRRYNREIILEAAAVFNREDWRFIASNGKAGRRPKGPPSVVFPWAGQVVMRSDYHPDAHWAFFDIGPWGTGHQHNDKLHISVSAFGRDLLVDGGRFAYRGGLANKFRGYAVGSASHNVIIIDGAGQDAGPREATEPLDENHYRTEDRFDYAWGSFDRFKGLEGNAQHTRATFYVRDKFWVVVDKVESDRPRKVEALWHWHPATKINAGPGAVTATNHDRGNLNVIPVGDIQWKVEQTIGREEPSPQGWYSERYNKAEPAPVTVYSATVRDASPIVWILHPTERKLPPLKGTLVSHDDKKVTVRVSDEKENEWTVEVPFSDSRAARYTFISGHEKKKRTGRLRVEE